MRENFPLVEISSIYKNTTRFALEDIEMNKQNAGVEWHIVVKTL